MVIILKLNNRFKWTHKIVYFFVFFLLFINFGCKNKHDKYIGIQIYNGFDETLSDSISASIERIYSYKTTFLPKMDLPQDAFVNIKSPRYRADSLIKNLNSQLADSLITIIGLTNKDISTSKKSKDGKILKPESKYKDWGVFGLGYIGKGGCVVSTFRIKNVSRALLISRIQKICIHEIGHNLGLSHCTSQKCVMQDAVEKVSTVDQSELQLCNKCRKKIN